ncbi:hypothetical protein U0070_017085 [Myodes glareolus]|uniref:Uncharacterized protein n=1 Tax=Myodes glareolus TaxID=447135 RepID=A0AAW0JHV5_MYOGA
MPLFKMKKFNFRKVLDGLTASSPGSGSSSGSNSGGAGSGSVHPGGTAGVLREEIQESLTSDYFQICKMFLPRPEKSGCPAMWEVQGPPPSIQVYKAISTPLFQTVRHGFPYQPTALAFDPVQKILAIGTRTALALFWLLFGLMSGIDSLLLRLSFSTSSLSGNRNQEQMVVRRKETKEDGQSHSPKSSQGFLPCGKFKFLPPPSKSRKDQEGECPNRLDPQNPVYAEETGPSIIVNGFSERLRASHIQRIRPNSENLIVG